MWREQRDLSYRGSSGYDQLEEEGALYNKALFRGKKEDIGTLVGERSFGGMLSGQTFPLENNDIKVFLPIADFQTATGERIDKVGVTPDIEVPSEEALDYILEELIK